jgi:hypothetical protein
MAIYANITVDQGSDYFSTVYVEDASGGVADLTGFTSRGQVRKTYSSLTSYDFITAIANPELGSIEISLTNSTTSSMKPGRYVYDIEVVSSSGTVTRVIEGQLEITPSVTR